jgi:hypothetical protein
MATTQLEHPSTMGKRDDKAVKIRRDLAIKAKLIAEMKGISVAEYLSVLLRPHIEKDWPKAVKKADELPSEDEDRKPTTSGE